MASIAMFFLLLVFWFSFFPYKNGHNFGYWPCLDTASYNVKSFNQPPDRCVSSKVNSPAPGVAYGVCYGMLMYVVSSRRTVAVIKMLQGFLKIFWASFVLSIVFLQKTFAFWFFHSCKQMWFRSCFFGALLLAKNRGLDSAFWCSPSCKLSWSKLWLLLQLLGKTQTIW